MIHSLRQRHRRLFATLGLLLPLAFAGGVAARKTVPKMSALPPELVTAPRTATTRIWERTDLFTNAPIAIRVRLLRETAAPGSYAVALSAPEDFLQPDVLVYWVADPKDLTGALPANAQLLGTLGSDALILPGSPVAQTGTLLLYRLADYQIAARSGPLEIPPSNTP